MGSLQSLGGAAAAPERDPAQILADLGAILRWIPEEDRLHDPDPEKRGVQVLRAAYAVLNRRP
jgi:hypothetical protein